MKTNEQGLRIAAFGAVLAGALTSPLLSAEPAVDPDADRILKAACKYLADARSFSVNVEVWKDVTLPSGQKLQTSRTVAVQEQRPNQLHLEVHSPRASRGFWLQGKSLTMLDREANLYGVMEVTDTIDEAIDSVEDRFGIEIPLGDVLVADPYRNLIDRVESADYFGKVTVLGVSCEHLAFTGTNADCQIWIAEGAAPLPRKIVINFKKEEGSPQVTQLFSDWDLTSPVSASVFSFAAPEGAGKIEVASESEAKAPEGGTPQKAEEGK